MPRNIVKIVNILSKVSILVPNAAGWIAHDQEEEKLETYFCIPCHEEIDMGCQFWCLLLREFGRWLTKVRTALNKKSMHTCCQCIFAPPSSSRCCTKMESMWSNTSESINELTSTWSVGLFSIPPHLQVVVEGGGWRCPCAHLSLWERSLVKASRIWLLPCETRTRPFFRSFRNP